MAFPRDITLNFLGPGTIEVAQRFRYCRVLEADSALFMSFDDGRELKRRVGQGVDHGEKFRTVNVRSTEAQAVRLVFSDQDQPDDVSDRDIASTVFISNGPSDALPIEEKAADAVNALDDVSLVAGAAAVTIAAANVNRVGVIVSVPLDLPAGIRVGDGASATKGVRLTAGDIAFISIVGAVKAFSEAANTTDQIVNATDVERI